MSLFRPIYKDKKTGQKMESATWWYEFIYAGKRYRESAKTTRKTLAGDREKTRRLELERQFTTGQRPTDPRRVMRTVKEALAEYQTGYNAPNHRPSSILWVKACCGHLNVHLGSVALMDLTETRAREYMRKRHEEKASNRTINMELLCLTRAAATTWRQLWPKVPKLQERVDIGRALSPEEEGRLLGAAARNKSPYIRSLIVVALCTGMRSGEIRTLQLKQINLQDRELRVGHSKTAAGEGREIPLENADLYAAIKGQIDWLIEEFGHPLPSWYLFPFCNRTKPIDPTRPITTIKSAWESVRTAAGVDCRFHDLRHTACTKMAENSTSEATMKALMGHMSQSMLERYSHIRDAAKRTAMKGLELAVAIEVIRKSKARKKRVPKVSPKVA